MEKKVAILAKFFIQHPKGWLETSSHSLGEGVWIITAKMRYQGAWGDIISFEGFVEDQFFDEINITGSNGTWDNDPCDLWSLLDEMIAEAKEMAELVD